MRRLAFATQVLPILVLLFPFGALAQNAWFAAQMPYGSGIYPVTVRISVDSLDHQGTTTTHFTQEAEYRGTDTAFYLRTTGALVSGKPLWQNTARSGVQHLETSYRDYTQTPALMSRFRTRPQLHTFENDALPEEFLYLQALQIDTTGQSLKILPSVWEVPYAPGAWTAEGTLTGKESRIDGVDCYQVLYTRIDGPTAEFHISQAGHQIIAFKTFRGTWFKRVQ
jgi:hypothetical protein